MTKQSGNKKEMTATTLRNTLITFVILMFIIAGVGFYFAYSSVTGYAKEVNNTVATAAASGSTDSSLSTLQTTLLKQQSVATLANGLYAGSATWQTQVIKDINTYAAASGITVTDFDLTSTTATPSATAITPTAGAAVTVTPSQTFTVSLGTPVSYTGLLTFMSYIDANIPKMQVAGVDLARGNDPGTVSIASLTIGIYVR